MLRLRPGAGRRGRAAHLRRAPAALALVIAAVAEAVSTRAQPLNVDTGFSIIGGLAVLLTCALARVFAEGMIMREDV